MRSRTFSVLLVVMLLSGSFIAIESTNEDFSFIGTVRAEGNVTWSQLNDTIDSLKIWLLDELTYIMENQTMMMENQNNLSEQIDGIVDNVTALIFGNETVNASLIEYIDQRWNLSDKNISFYVQEINLSSLNESSVMGVLLDIQNRLGYIGMDENFSVAKDLQSLLNQTVVWFGYLFNNQESISTILEGLITSQLLLSAQMVNSTNATMSMVLEDGKATRGHVTKEAQWVADNSSSIWALVAAVCSILILLWILRKNFLSRIFPGRNNDYDDDDYEHNENRQYDQYEGRREGIVSKAMAPLKFMAGVRSNEIPPCYRDGRSYSLTTRQECAVCPHRNDCASEMIARNTVREPRPTLQDERAYGQGEFSVDRLQTGEIPLQPEPERNLDDLSSW